MKSAEFLEFVRNMEKGVFTINDVAKIIRKDERYCRLFVHRLKKRGLMEEIERGKFALFGHPFSVASCVIFPSYVSFFSGLSYYDLTTQMPRKIYVAALKSKKTIKLSDYEIQFIKLKKERFFGYAREKYRGKIVFIASLEKVIVDSLLLPQYCPSGEIFGALRSALNGGKIDLRKLIRYAIKMKSSVVLKRLGFMLELGGHNYYGLLKKKLTKKLDTLDPLGTKTDRKSAKWRLYINEELL